MSVWLSFLVVSREVTILSFVETKMKEVWETKHLKEV